MYIEVGTDGHVRKEVILQPMGLGLDEKALDAASLWRFQPAMLEGKPVAVIAQIEVNFRLLG